MTVCPTCGAAREGKSTICRACGNDLPSAPRQRPVRAGVPSPAASGGNADSPGVGRVVRDPFVQPDGQFRMMVGDGPEIVLAAGNEYNLGRDPTFCPIGATFGPNISEQHACVWVADGRCFVRDLDSTNGTRVNGMPIAPGMDHEVSDGDLIGLAVKNMVVLRVSRDTE